MNRQAGRQDEKKRKMTKPNHHFSCRIWITDYYVTHHATHDNTALYHG